jgi:hypothetical protein
MLGLINSMGQLISGMADRIVFLEGLTRGMGDRLDRIERDHTVRMNEMAYNLESAATRLHARINKIIQRLGLVIFDDPDG